MLPEALLLKYLKIKALAEQGVPGERETAQGILTKMETEHAGIRVQAGRLLRARQRESEQRTAPPPPPRPKRQAPPGVHYKDESDEASSPWNARGEDRGRAGNWENIFQYAKAAVNGAYDFAETISNAAAGRNLADELAISSRMTNTGFISLTLKLPFGAYQKVLGLNALQKTAFRQALHEKLDSHLDRLLGD